MPRRPASHSFEAARSARGPLLSPQAAARRGAALVAVLWSLVILAVVVVSTARGTRLELRIAKNFGDMHAARFLAIAGVEKAKALLHEELQSLTENRLLRAYDDPASFREVALGQGFFRVLRAAEPGESADAVVYGIRDEERRLNVNTATPEELAALPGMDREIAAAIVDWRDADDRVTPGGAEGDAYASLVPPIVPRNAPFETIRELLLVRGVTPELLLGEDANANGILDPEEDDGSDSPPFDNGDGILDAGLSALITVESAAPNVNALGEPRLNLQTAAEAELAEVEGISADLAKAIVAHRGGKAFENIADLFDVEAVREVTEQSSGQTPPSDAGREPPPPPAPASGGSPGGGRGRGGRPDAGGRPPGGGGAQPESPRAAPVQGGSTTTRTETTGEKLVDEAVLKLIADEVTVRSERELAGRMNCNTASARVLACVSGLDGPLADAIVAHRRAYGPFANVAELLDVPGMTREIFKRVAERFCVRSGTFSITAEGIVPTTGARRRICAVVRPDGYSIKTLCWREGP